MIMTFTVDMLVQVQYIMQNKLIHKVYLSFF